MSIGRSAYMTPEELETQNKEDAKTLKRLILMVLGVVLLTFVIRMLVLFFHESQVPEDT